MYGRSILSLLLLFISHDAFSNKTVARYLFPLAQAPSAISMPALKKRFESVPVVCEHSQIFWRDKCPFAGFPASVSQKRLSFASLQKMRIAHREYPVSARSVDGDGDCIFSSVIALTGDRSINRREFVRRLLQKNRELQEKIQAGIALNPQEQILLSVFDGIVFHAPHDISQQADLVAWAEYFLTPISDDFGPEYPMADHPVLQSIAMLFGFNLALMTVDPNGGVFVPFQTLHSTGQGTADPSVPTFYIGYVTYDPSGSVLAVGEPNHFIPISLDVDSVPPSLPVESRSYLRLPELRALHHIAYRTLPGFTR